MRFARADLWTRGAVARATSGSPWSGTCSARVASAGTASSGPSSCAATGRSSGGTTDVTCALEVARAVTARGQASCRGVQDGLVRRVPAAAAGRRGGAARPGRRARHRALRGGEPRDEPGPYDVTLVEGSVSTPAQLEQIARDPRGVELPDHDRRVRDVGRRAGAPQLEDLDETVRAVYPTPSLHPLARRPPRRSPITCAVDLELHGLPGRPRSAARRDRWLLQGSMPRLPTLPVCVECKRRGYVCVVVAKGEPCLGPVTRTGCGALCPALDRGCYGCFGPSQPPNTRGARAAVRGARDVAGSWPRPVPVHHRIGAGRSERRPTGRDTRIAPDAEPLVEVPVDRAGGGRGRAAHQARRRRDRGPPAGDLRAAPVLRGLPARDGISRRCPTSCRGSAGSARSRTR